jgi:hypothetical protein
MTPLNLMHTLVVLVDCLVPGGEHNDGAAATVKDDGIGDAN